MIWPRFFTGTLYKADFTPSLLIENYQVTVTASGSPSDSVNFTTNACSNQPIPLAGFTFSCVSASIILSAAAPIDSTSFISVTAISAKGYSLSFTAKIQTLGKLLYIQLNNKNIAEATDCK